MLFRSRLSLAGPANRPDTPLRHLTQAKVATKYPRLATEFFRQRGINAEIIYLNGSVELAPLVGLADMIVDMVETGETLRANGLAEFRTLLESQAVLITNRAAQRRTLSKKYEKFYDTDTRIFPHYGREIRPIACLCR